jgi:hypothetical protein
MATVALLMHSDTKRDKEASVTKASGGNTPEAERYWPNRVRSSTFKHHVRELVEREFATLAKRRLQNVVDAAAVRASIKEWHPRPADRNLLADLVVRAGRELNARLAREERSALQLVDADVARAIDDLLDEDFELPPGIDEFVARMMQQAFIEDLLADVVYTAIAAFNRRVNPLLASVTARMLEDQIRGFISLVMPTLQRQAVAFATNRANQRVAIDFTRAATRELLNEPLRTYAATVSPGQRERAEALVAKTLRTPRLDRMLRDAVLSAWDAFYKRNRLKPLGTLVSLDRYAGFVADRIVEVLQLILARPDVLQFILAEIARAPSSDS